VSGQVVLTVEDLKIVIEPSGILIDDEVSLTIRQGEVLGLVGESASGKTTVATALLKHQRRGAKIAGGRVLVGGRDVLALSGEELREVRGGLISYVPQDASASLNPAVRIGTQLMEILEAHDYGASGSARTERLEEMMAEVLLPSDRQFLRRYPHQLSGGQQQRVAVAMAFACRPKVIVLDEPTTALDVTTQAHVLETVKGLSESYGVAALYVTHDLAVVANLADRIAVMYAGRLVEVGSRNDLFTRSLHPYSRKLLAAIPDLTGNRALQGIPGSAPRPGSRPEGCAFAPRCDWVIDRCLSEFPPVDGPGADHQVRCWRHAEVGAEPMGSDAKGAERVKFDPSLENVIAVSGLSAYYGRKKTLHDVTMHLHTRRCIALVGESGSGKTTLARCVAGLHHFKIEGSIKHRDKELARDARGRDRATRQTIQYIFQSPYSSLNPRKTVRQILTQPLRVFFDFSKSETEDRVAFALEQVALDTSVLRRYPDEMSGGERQRVAIARALAAEPTVLICDEVTSSLDVSVQAAIVELLAQLQHETGLSMLFVTHNLALVRSIAQEVAVMSEGRIVEAGTVDKVLEDPQADYTRKLLSDTPTI